MHRLGQVARITNCTNKVSREDPGELISQSFFGYSMRPNAVKRFVN